MKKRSAIPQANEAEAAVIASVVADSNLLAVARESLEPHHFHDPVRYAIFATLCRLQDTSNPHDAASLKIELAATGKLDYIGGDEFIRSLQDAAPTEGTLRYYISAVTEAAGKRDLLRLGTELEQQALDGEPLSVIADEATKRLQNITVGANANAALAQFLLAAAYETLPKYAEPRFIIDHLVPEQSLVLLSGDTGSGKTAFAAHLCIAYEHGLPVAEKFDTARDDRPSAYILGASEMSAERLAAYLHEVAAGLKVHIPKSGLLISQPHGTAQIRFTMLAEDEQRKAFAAAIKSVRPAFVVLDSLRALFAIDENLAGEVRPAMGWLRELAEETGTSFVVLHHVRKLGTTSNSARERTAGSRDLLAAVDVHLAALSSGGRPMNALLLDKTRMAKGAVMGGTQWKLRALRTEPNEDGVAGMQFQAEDPETIEPGASLEDAREDVMALLRDGPKTIAEMGADSGNRKRAYEDLRRSGEVVEQGKRGRKALYCLADDAARPLFDSGEPE